MIPTHILIPIKDVKEINKIIKSCYEKGESAIGIIKVREKLKLGKQISLNESDIENLFKKYSNLCHFEEGKPEYLIDIDDFKQALKDLLL